MEGAAIFGSVSLLLAESGPSSYCAVTLKIRSDRTHTEAVRLALGELCLDHHLLLLFFFGFALSFRLPGLQNSGGRCAVARRPPRSSTNCVVAPQASSPRLPPLASLSFCPRVRL